MKIDIRINLQFKSRLVDFKYPIKAETRWANYSFSF